MTQSEALVIFGGLTVGGFILGLACWYYAYKLLRNYINVTDNRARAQMNRTNAQGVEIFSTVDDAIRTKRAEHFKAEGSGCAAIFSLPLALIGLALFFGGLSAAFSFLQIAGMSQTEFVAGWRHELQRQGATSR